MFLEKQQSEDRPACYKIKRVSTSNNQKTNNILY